MRKKQLFAMALAGAIVIGTSPSAAFAETAVSTETIVGEQFSEDTPETPTDIETDLGEGSEVSEEQTQTTETPAVPEQTAETVSVNVVHSEQELLSAISAAPDAETTVISIASDLTVSATITIPASQKITLTSDGAQIRILRGEGFYGDLFHVDGTLILQRSDEDFSLSGTLTVNGDLLDGTSQGSLIRVSENGIFAMDDSVTLMNNTTSGQGGAIYNSGTVMMLGGTIRGCSAQSGGAVYNDSVMSVEGETILSENTSSDGITADNVCISANGTFYVDGALTGASTIGIHAEEGNTGSEVIRLGSNAGDLSLEGVLPYFVYDDAEVSLDETGAVAEPEITPSLQRVEGPVWTSESSVQITCVADRDGWYYAGTAEKGGDVPIFDVNEDGIPVTAGQAFTVTVENITETNPVLYVLVKDTDNQLSAKKAAELDLATRPGASAEEAGPSSPDAPNAAPAADTEAADLTSDPSETVSSEENVAADPQSTSDGQLTHPYLADISQTQIDGLDGRLAFEKGTYYDFTVLGAGGLDVNPAPESGDIKWVPSSWKIKEDGALQTIEDPAETLKLGFEEGIYDSTDPFYLYFTMDKYEYVDGSWVKSDVSEPFSYKVTPALLHIPVVPDPNTSAVTGLDEPLKFYAGYEYPFQVVGAGEDNENPGEGDVRFIPISWSLDDDATQHIEWSIGFEDGIYNQEKVMAMKIYLGKEIYVNDEWEPTEEEVVIQHEVKAAFLTEEEPVPTPIPTVTPVPDTPDIGGDVTPTPAPIISNIKDYTVTGLSAPLRMLPKTYYPFSVIGAGMNLNNPPAGSTRWNPVYWTTNSDNAKEQTTWKIGSVGGISEAKTIPIRVFFQEQIFRDGKWVNTEKVPQYQTINIQTEAFDKALLSVTPTPYQGADGNYYYADGTLAYTAEEAEAAQIAENAKTGDETPLATLMLLASLSLITAGYVIVRKRKKA